MDAPPATWPRPHRLPHGCRRGCAQLAVDADRDPATLPIHGRVYLGDGWQKQVDEALEVGVAHLSIGFNRMANRGLTHAQHLDAVLAVKPELDRLVGRS